MQTNTNTTPALRGKDYLLVSFIGASFGLFSIPILKNLDLPFLQLSSVLYVGIIIFFVVFANIAIYIASLLGRVIPVIFQFAKFAAVGAFNTFLDWGVLNLLIAATGYAAGIYYTGFKAFSFLLATMASFFWNKYWTFGQNKSTDNREVSSFLVVSLIGMLINATLASLIVYIFSSSDILPARVANMGAAIATVISLIWNFVGYKFFVFKK